jgi:serine/threonine-protein kinase
MSDLDTRLSQALSDRYAIKREIGRGGMATVYLARDLRHDRDVALKVIHPFIASGIGSRRFEQEIRLAARLQHPHIVSVHDSGVAPPDAPGEPHRLWFTMPFVEGESLRDRLRREGQLPVADAVRITRQIADALDYAHKHGVVHRDIKPENILLTGSHAMVTDFGVAIAATAEDGSPMDTLTAAGTTVGTVAYMSPEQCSAERNIDGRSDQYAVGCVLYEMLVGEPPFTGPTSQIVMNRRFQEDPRPLRVARPGLPEAVERVVHTSLSRLPADRFATMSDFGATLDTALTTTAAQAPGRTRPTLQTRASIAAAMAIVALGIWRLLPATSSAADLPLRMVVVPFQLQGDSADAYLAEGMADEVSVKLANVAQLELISRYSARQYRHMDKPLEQVAEELGVRLLLTGVVNWVRKTGEQVVVVRAELVEQKPDGALVSRWAETFNFPFVDVFEVQTTIANKIAGALQVALTPETKAVLAAAPTTDSAAYLEFLRGEQAYLRSGPNAQFEALARYESALARDSMFARAWARLSMINTSIYVRTTEAGRAEASRHAAERALAVDPRLADAHLAMGNYYSLVQGDYARAIPAYEAGLKLRPDHAELLNGIGLSLQAIGRWDEGINQMRRSLALDPRSSIIARRLTRALTYAHRYEEGDEVSRLAIAIDQSDVSAHQYAVLLRLAQGNLTEARALIRAIPKADLIKMLPYWSTNFPINVWFLEESDKESLQRLPSSKWGVEPSARLGVLQVFAFRRGDLALARAYADSVGRAFKAAAIDSSDPESKIYYASWASLVGDKADAVRQAEAAIAARTDDEVFGPQLRHNVIQICLQAGAYEKALDHLEILVKQNYQVTPAWLRIDPSFDLIRNHPRFQAIVNSAR